MRFLVDAQLPPILARWLAEHGHEARHVFEVMAPDAPDRNLWSFVSENRSVLVSKDHDFVPIARTTRTAQLLWVRIGNTANASLLAAMERGWTALEAALRAGQPVVEVTGP